jgi:transcriptional regulator of arginine metabolism
MNKYSTGSTLRRRAAILALVQGGPLRSQEELQRRLRGRGIAVAQPTLSRDLKALGLAKTPAGYTRPAGSPDGVARERGARPVVDRVLKDFVLAVRAAGSLVVVRTPPAAAPTVARAVDEAGLAGVVGTIAGDDTIFLATRGTVAARRLERRLLAPFGRLRRGLRPGGVPPLGRG